MEDFAVDLNEVTALELKIIPKVSRGDARASPLIGGLRPEQGRALDQVISAEHGKTEYDDSRDNYR